MGLGEGMNLDEELCRFCKSNKVLIKQFSRPPKGETNFGFLPYNRSLWQCTGCQHITNKHNFNIDTNFYKKTYQRTTYKEKARSRFTDLMSLPREQSDNRQRVNFIDNFWNDTQPNKEKSCLDVGSGLGVFPAVLKELNWDCVAIEPDPEACEIIREQIGIEVLSGDLIECHKIGEFNLSQGTGFKIPSFYALNNGLVGDKSLVPETNLSRSLSFKKEFIDNNTINFLINRTEYKNLINYSNTKFKMVNED